MFDMLQLVVEAGDTQLCVIVKQSVIEFSQHHDKLKHVGQLARAVRVISWIV